jgi:uncharacterized flavoprotein (TIGR03862 family)
MKKKSIAVIGGGPAALMFAAQVDATLFDIAIYEKNKQFGRKFLVAGKGGFNLTHSEDLEVFIQRYTPLEFLATALRSFTNDDLRDWFESIGIPTMIGSSKRVYPEKGIKPIEVLEAILNQLKKKGIQFQFDHEWLGWNEKNELVFGHDTVVKADKVVFSLGGASWSVTGSTGSWLEIFEKKGIETIHFQPSNCAFQINWNKSFIEQHEGQPLKNCAITCGNKTQKGEGVFTKFGLEGNVIYALSPQIREQLNKIGKAAIFIDFKPTLSEIEVLKKLESSTQKKVTETLKKELKLNAPQIALLKSATSKEEFSELKTLAHRIKQIPLEVIGTAPIDDAISTVGGISRNALSPTFEIKKLPNHYCIGEMVDWDAPTGGYLLQACFSMGAFLEKTL